MKQKNQQLASDDISKSLNKKGFVKLYEKLTKFILKFKNLQSVLF